ncbi:hypothetical protein SNE40_010810 [Patella caerulea]|uniref:AIG1-type G domain-containing protein n=1 Tax=Patella caerulea TaxID=87958 RepID=A0AAN8K2R0_PATCE
MTGIETYRVVVVGKTGVGKSSFCNRMANNNVFKTAAGASSVTRMPQKIEIRFNDEQTCEFIDMPGLFDTKRTHDEMDTILGSCVNLSLPGPHVFLYVISIASRFTEEDEKTLLKLSQIFGDEVFTYMLVIFTCKNNLNHSGQSEMQYIEEMVHSLCSAGQATPQHIDYLISALNEGRYAFIECYGSESTSRPDVVGVSTKINQLIKANQGRHYTSQIYEKAVEKMVLERNKAILRKYGKDGLLVLTGLGLSAMPYFLHVIGTAAAGSGKLAAGATIGGMMVVATAGTGALATEKGGYHAASHFLDSIATAAVPYFSRFIATAAAGSRKVATGATIGGEVVATAGSGVVATGEAAVGTGVVATGEAAVGTEVVATGEVALGTEVVATEEVSTGQVAAGSGVVATGEAAVGTGVVATGEAAVGTGVVATGEAAVGTGVVATGEVALGTEVVATEEVAAGTGEAAVGTGVVATGEVALGTEVVATEEVSTRQVAAGSGVVATGEAAVGTDVVATGEAAVGTGVVATGEAAVGTGVVATGEVAHGTEVVATE